jgi:NAD(P)-dependent dehydrogenase (short-subunit alcohol dehydrogenase family)
MGRRVCGPYGESSTEKETTLLKLDGRTVLVTGANRGLGARLVGTILDAGAAKVWAAARNPNSLAPDVLAHDRVVPLELDITDEASIDAASARAGDIDVLVNNAGILDFGGPLDGDLDGFARNLTTNYLGTLRVTRAFVPVLERNAPSAIVNVLTVTALAPIRSLAGYSASKAASHSMTQALRAELKDRGIDVMGVYPALIDTDMVAPIPADKTAPEHVAARIIEGIEAGETVIWPDPVSAGAGTTYLGNPIALEAMLAAF